MKSRAPANVSKKSIISFHAFVHTQFQRPIMCIQKDNGKEFDIGALRSFLAAHGIVLRLTCPYTLQQNGCAERVSAAPHTK